MFKSDPILPNNGYSIFEVYSVTESAVAVTHQIGNDSHISNDPDPAKFCPTTFSYEVNVVMDDGSALKPIFSFDSITRELTVYS